MEVSQFFDKNRFSASVDTFSEEVKSETQNAIAKLMKDEADKIDSEEVYATFESFKNDVTVSPEGNFSDKVYQAVLGRIVKVAAPNLSADDGEGSIIKKISTFINEILDPKDQSVTDETGKKYKISSPFGTTSNVVIVTEYNEGSTTEYTFTWSEYTSEASLKSLLESMTELGKEYSDLQRLVAKEITETALTSLVTFWANAILDGDSDSAEKFQNSLKDALGSFSSAVDFSGDASNWLSNFTKQIFTQNNKEMSEIAKKYEDFKNNVNSLVDEIEKKENLNEFTLTNARHYKNFENAYEKLNTSVGGFSAAVSNFFVNIENDYISTAISETSSGSFAQNYAIINGTNGDDFISSTG